MSAANAAAKKRRANLGSTNPVPSQQTNVSTQSPLSSSSSKSGLTLPQVIALVDSRLTKLEDAAQKQKPASSVNSDHVSEEALKPILQEYDHRFTMLATQISDLKEIVMKLQSYTMDVNKSLLEERIHFMNDSTSDFLQSSGTETGSETIKLDDLKLEETEIVSSEIVSDKNEELSAEETPTEEIITVETDIPPSTDV
jgi:hypothetical protein